MGIRIFYRQSFDLSQFRFDYFIFYVQQLRVLEEKAHPHSVFVHAEIPEKRSFLKAIAG